MKNKIVISDDEHLNYANGVAQALDKMSGEIILNSFISDKKKIRERNKEIAKRMFLSNSTIQFHVSNVLSKLGVSKRTEAAYLALKQKLVELPG